jgi:hypothetical protein
MTSTDKRRRIEQSFERRLVAGLFVLSLVSEPIRFGTAGSVRSGH